jgi:ABC-type multidrug transport system fused ATPase/permease subunit
VLANFFAQFLLQVAGNGFLFVGILALLIRESIAGGLLLSLYFILLLFLIICLRHLSLPHWHAARAASAAYYGFLEERLAGRETIRAYNAMAYVTRRFFDHLRTLWSRLYKAKLITSITDNSSAFLVNGGTGLAFTVGAVLYLSDSATIGSVYLIAHYVGMLFAPIRRILMEFEQLQAASASIVRVQEVLQVQSNVHDVGAGLLDANGRSPTLAHSAGPLVPQPPALVFEGVSFTYRHAAPEDGLVLRDVSFRLAPGQSLGILGRTGSGKSTITRLLFRLYDPHQGSIHLGSHDIRTLPLSVLRRHIGLVTQDVRLFHASVRHNLTFFDESMGDERLLDIIHHLGLAAWYGRLPEGLNTMVAPGGGNLSAGEAQLLAFARVFLQNPGLVVLDEASARLDVATEQLIERAVDRLLQGRTAVVIAHRLSTIMRADDILILDNGCIRETGRRAELLHNPDSYFSHLLQTDALLSGAGGVS